MAREKKQKEEGGGADWMATYGDMVTLLLCFFVLLFSFSEIDAKKFESIIRSFNGSLGVLEGGKTIDAEPFISVDKMPETTYAKKRQELQDFIELKAAIEEYAEKNNLGNRLIAEIDERGLIIRVLDNVFFDSGRSSIKADSKNIVLFIADALKQEEFKSHNIKFEGHTDSDPISTAQFPSNWELSTARASSVLRIFEEEQGFDSNRLSASGYGDNRPVAPNDTPSGKAKNRRVDIVVLKSYYDQFEPN